MKKGVGSGVGSGSISQRYGSRDPDPHQNITDPQHCLLANIKKNIPLPYKEKQDYKRKEVGGGGGNIANASK